MPPSDPTELAALLRAAAEMLDRGSASTPPLPPTVRQLLTLDQCAVMVNRTPAGLRHYKDRGMPPAATSFRRGQPKLYDWAVMRPWLEQTFGLLLPERHPSY